MIIKGVFREHHGCSSTGTMMKENVGAPGIEPHLYSKVMCKRFLKVSVWPYWDMENKTELESEAVSFWDMAFLPYLVMDGLSCWAITGTHTAGSG